MHEAANYFGHSYNGILKIWTKFKAIGDDKYKKWISRPQVISEAKKLEVGSYQSYPYVSLKSVSLEFEIGKTTAFRIAQELGLEYKFYIEHYSNNEAT